MSSGLNRTIKQGTNISEDDWEFISWEKLFHTQPRFYSNHAQDMA
jgi:hypothetical protein